MYKITETEFLTFFVHSNEFYGLDDIVDTYDNSELNCKDIRFRQSNNELVAFNDNGECFAKYLYWKV